MLSCKDLDQPFYRSLKPTDSVTDTGKSLKMLAHLKTILGILFSQSNKKHAILFLRIEKMYFWLRSATSNIHEAIPQTRGGEGAWGRVADWFDPPLIIHHPLNASKNSKYSPHLSKYSLLNSGWIQNFTVSTQSQDIG